MKIKQTNTPTILVLLILMTGSLLYSCQDWVDEEYKGTINQRCKYNVIGITGPESPEPYVEVQYCKEGDNHSNVIMSELISPPFLFGGHNVNIRCDSIIEITGYGSKGSHSKATGDYKLVLKHQYEKGEAEYVRIINHSADKAIEFFIAGTQDIRTKGLGCNGVEVIDAMPTVYYKNAPIYYLLFPEKKYRQNLQGNSVDCDDLFRFEGNECGNILLTKAWSVDEVMALYRAEFNNDSDTMLYLNTQFRNLGRLSKAVNSENPYIRYKQFYGVIKPGGELKGSTNLPLLATPNPFDDELINTTTH